MTTNNQEERALYELKKNLVALKDQFPTMFWVPNIAQERAVAPWVNPPYPFITLCTLANGTGKTNCLVQDIAGTCLGPDFVSADWNKSQYYTDIAKFRDGGKLRLRLLCNGDDMKEDGSAYQEIKEWIPCAKIDQKDSNGTYHRITIPHPHKVGVSNVIGVKTFNQQQTAHAGTNLHRIWVNEPPPFPVWGETVARTRSKAGQPQCHILVYATVVDQQGYLFDILDNELMSDRVAHIEGSSWENCIGEELPESAVRELTKRGRPVQKDKDGNYITRGVLTRQSIENQIETWKQTDPASVDARTWGEPMYLAGVIFKNFNINVHVVEPYPLPRNYPIVQVVDPHPRRPDMTGYFMVTPLQQLIGVAEWPLESYELIKTRDYTIEQTCEAWRRLEEELGFERQIVERWGDPNRFRDPDPETGMTLAQLYADHGFDFNTTINDSLEYGHRTVESFLYYNHEIRAANTSDPAGWPRLRFFRRCNNLVRAITRYSWKEKRDPTQALSEQVNQKYKDGADVVRYACVSFDSFRYSTIGRHGRETAQSDSERVKAARNPRMSKNRRERIKGRYIVD